MSITKYRNILLALIFCNLGWFVFPFPPAIWRLLITVVSLLIAFKFRMGRFDSFQRNTLFCLLLTLTYFFSGLVYGDISSTGDITYSSEINMCVSLTGMVAFSVLGQNGVLTKKSMLVAMLVCVLLAIPNFFLYQINAIEDYANAGEVTNNATSIFLWLLPFIFIFSNNISTVIIVLVTLYFIIMGAKRGNIVASIPAYLLYIFSLFADSSIKLRYKFILLLAMMAVASVAYYWVITNDYLLQRYAETLTGYSSGRDVIYTKMWNHWVNAESLWNMIFGFGYAATVKIIDMAHNDWLEFLVDYGIVGVMFYFFMVLSLVRYWVNTKDRKGRWIFSCVIVIWFVKSMISMCILDDQMILMAIPLGYAIQTYHNPDANAS